MITQPKSRGEAVRRALLAIVEARAVAGLPMPPHRTMAAALGISHGQVTRHLGVLMDQGAFRTRQAGMRQRIEEIAA
jgi:DNA-binding transcriptional MocR family regulator